MEQETYNGTPLPEGWTRVRTGLIQHGDRARGDDRTWINLPDRYVGGGVGMFTCVIRKIKVRKKKKK